MSGDTLDRGRTQIHEHLSNRMVQQATAQLEKGNSDPFVIACSLSFESLDTVTDARADWHHKYDLAPHIRTMVFYHLRGDNNWSALHRFLSKKDRATTIGYDPEKFTSDNSAPSRTALTRAWNDYMSDPLKNTIVHAATEIRKTAREHAAPVDVDALDQEDREDASTRTKQRVKSEASEDVARKTREWFYPEIDLGLAEDAIFENEDLLDLMVHMCRERDFANNAANTWSLDSDDRRKTPSGDTLRDHIRAFDELENNEVTELFDNAKETLWTIAERKGFLNGIVDVAIDEHNWRHYSDLETPRTMQVKHDNGTNRAYQFLTLSVIGETGERFVVDFHQVASKQEKVEGVKQLVNEAQERLIVRDVFMDRGFSQVLYIQALHETGANFVIRARRNSKTKKMWENVDEDGINIEHDVTMSRSRAPYESTTVTRVVTPPKEGSGDEYFTYITNRTLTKRSAQRIAKSYERRWGIETSFRVVLDFLPRTASMDFALRMFYFSFATLFYNMWVLVNLLVREALGIPEAETPPVTAKMLLAYVHNLWDNAVS